jgi:ATP-dependent helicase/nuclease subunit B
MLTPLVSLLFGGPNITEQGELPAGHAVLGRPVWDPSRLLTQLELRLGLPPSQVEEVMRVQRWSVCLCEAELQERRFYSNSYATDPLGTAKALLGWRDALLLAGWDGQIVPNGGARLDVLSELESAAALSEHAPGVPDRLLRVALELDRSRLRVFERLELAEEIALWPQLWRRTFQALEGCAVPVEVTRSSLPGAAEGDLGMLQAAIRRGTTEPIELMGDGSVVLLEAETAWELAQAAAALLRAEHTRTSRIVVIRGGDARALDAALAGQGLPSQGVVARSAFRPALQVLSLTLELAFEPRDPQRVFELVTLPDGPFWGKVGRELAKALADAPGIGGRPWLAAKQRLRASEVDEIELQRIAEWLEGPTHDPSRGAPIAALVRVAQRVADWLTAALTRTYATLDDTPEGVVAERRLQVLGAALEQVRAFERAMEHDGRTALRAVEVRHLLEEVTGAPRGVELTVESAGRLDHVARPGAVCAERDLVLWWYCAAGTEWQPQTPAWREQELRALAAAGVRFVDVSARLAAEAEAWLAPVFAARSRLVLAVPRSALGVELAPHPMVDELAARITRPALERIRVHVREWLHGTSKGSAVHAGSMVWATAAPLGLPPARAAWAIDPANVPQATSYNTSSLEALAQCPLKWMLRHGAGLYPASNRSIPRGARLNGKLAHRLVEELVTEGALSDPRCAAQRCEEFFDRLTVEEASVLLCSGQRTELVQLRAQLCAAIEALSAWIVGSSLDIIGVEAPVRASWRGKELTGRIDLLLADASGREIVVDLKWGSRHYGELLRKGMALQLAIYSWMRQLEQRSSALPTIGYFCLSSAKLITTETSIAGADEATAGASAGEVWRRLEATVDLVERKLGSGCVPVTGVARSLPLWADPDTPAADGAEYLPFENGRACTYCDYAAICGRSWEQYT